MKIRDRIKELRRVKASELRPNPKNWRTHPTAQLDALKGVLAEVGMAGAALARELPDGTLELIDGHARAETCGDEPIPVLVLDVTAAESDTLLATFDPLGALAGVNAERLEGLLNEVVTESGAVQAMLDQLAATAGLDVHVEEPKAEDERAGVEDIPEQFQVLVILDSENDQAELLERLAGEGYKVRSLIS